MKVLATVLATGLLWASGATGVKAQVVISDTVGFFWTVVDTGFFGGALYTSIPFYGGNPGQYRYMRHDLPAPPGPQDLTSVEGAHIYHFDGYSAYDQIVSIDYEEDIRLLDVPWADAFIRSYPLIRVNGRLFRASSYIEARGDTNWMHGRLEGLTADDFTALDGSGDHPDFGGSGDLMHFGYWRGSSRSSTLPPIPANELLVYEHASDNFRVTIHQQIDPPDQPANQPPVANVDDFWYVDFYLNTSRGFPVLLNDSDPDGDPIQVIAVGESTRGEILSYGNGLITYRLKEPTFFDFDTFTYDISDGTDVATGFVWVHFCTCPVECISTFLGGPVGTAPRGSAGPIGLKNGVENTTAADDTVDVDLYRRFRDDVLLETDRGSQLVDAYYRLAPELIPTLIVSRPDLGLLALRTLRTMQATVREVLDGEDPVLTQELVDDIRAVTDGLLTVASDSLRSFIEGEMARVGPLDDLVGMPVAEVLSEVVGVAIERPTQELPEPTKAELRQNYPNPFGDRTTIEYYLPVPGPVEVVIYDLVGRRVAAIDAGRQSAGRHAVEWNGRDASGRLLADGVYLYEIRSGPTRVARKMVLTR